MDFSATPLRRYAATPLRRYALSLLVILTGSLGLPAQAQNNWFDVAMISDTMGVNSGRVCIGEASRQDIGCPTYAPSVLSSGLLTATSIATGGLTVTGATSLSTVSATVGGFGALGVAGDYGYMYPGGIGFGANSSDSPNLASIAWGDNTGWRLNFGTSVGGIFTPKISFIDTGNIGVGTSNPSSSVHVVNGEIQTASSGASCTSALGGAIRYTGGTLSYCNGVSATWALIGGASGGTPAGVSGSIQFNSGGAFAGRSDLVVDAEGNIVGKNFSSQGSVAGFGFADRAVPSTFSVLYRTDNKTRLFDNTLGDQFVLDNTNGNVGIGAANPNWKLQIDTPSFTPSGASDGLTLNQGLGGHPAMIRGFSQGAGGTFVTPAAAMKDQSLLRLSASGYWPGKANPFFEQGDGRALLSFIADTDFLATDHATAMVINLTPPSSTTVVERLRITSAGNVGIGTAAPNASLEVVGRVSASVFQLATDAGACTAATLGTFRRDPATGKVQICRE